MKLLVIIALAALATTRLARAQYTFGPEIQSTNTANITYDVGTGAFQYVASANLSNGFAGLPLTGPIANLITSSDGWSASINADLSARSMPASGAEAYAAIGLYVIVNSNNADSAYISLTQENNTGSGVNNNFDGTLAYFVAVTNSVNLATIPAVGSSAFQGASFQELSGSRSATATTESIDAASGVLTLSNEVSTGNVAGYYNGTLIGSIPLDSWGPNPSLSIAVVGFSTGDVDVLSGTATATNFFADRSLLVTTTTLPDGTNNEPYSQTLVASGGVEPFTWTNISGFLPPGLTLATNGVISGTPASVGTFSFTVEVIDALSGTQMQQLTLTSLQSGTPFTPSEPQLTAGKTSFTFQLSGPSGGNYVLQSSTNLLNWNSLSTSAIPAIGTITLTNSATGDRGFYRAYLQ